jgi:hypothetical protein
MKRSHRDFGGKLPLALLTLLLLLLSPSLNYSSPQAARALALQEQESPRVLRRPQGARHRRVRGDRRRGRHSIRRSFARAGRSAGRGGKRFGQNVARGRLARGGKEFGKGMGGFGKHTGRGVGRTMRRVFKP